MGQRFPLLASTRVYGILFLRVFLSSPSPSSPSSPSSQAEGEGGLGGSILEPLVAIGGLIFLRLGGRGRAVNKEVGWKVSSSEEAEKGEESELGDCFTRRRLRLATDLGGVSLRGFLGRGLVVGVGGV